MTRGLFAIWLFSLMLGCSGAGRYGYSRQYVPLSEEEPFARRTNETVYDEVRRMPDHFRGQTVSWFGVVSDVQSARNGVYRVVMQVRTHQDRHLCEDETDGSCRVTINERDVGPFTALVRLSPEDAHGENRVQATSLLRVYGEVVIGEYDANGGPILRATYYRHWPAGQYVTTGARGGWRR